LVRLTAHGFVADFYAGDSLLLVSGENTPKRCELLPIVSRTPNYFAYGREAVSPLPSVAVIVFPAATLEGIDLAAGQRI